MELVPMDKKLAEAYDRLFIFEMKRSYLTPEEKKSSRVEMARLILKSNFEKAKTDSLNSGKRKIGGVASFASPVKN